MEYFFAYSDCLFKAGFQLAAKSNSSRAASRQSAKRVCGSRKTAFAGWSGLTQMQTLQTDPEKSIFREYTFLRIDFAGSTLCAAASHISSACKYQIRHNSTVKNELNNSNQT